jgi:hypothetical protein
MRTAYSAFPFLLALCLAGAPAFGNGKVHYANKSVAIANSFEDHMQCVLDRLKDKQYVPRDVGCFGSRPNNRSAHPTGHACDVDQTARNVTRLNGRVEKSVQIQIAKTCKAVSGCSWTRTKHSPDCGHFEAMGKEGYVAAGGGHHYSGYDRHPVRRRR